MIKAHASARQGGDGRFYVTVRGDNGSINPFFEHTEGSFFHGYPNDAHACKAFVDDWIAKNCSGFAEIFGSTSVVFSDEGDAVLFWLTFKP